MFRALLLAPFLLAAPHADAPGYTKDAKLFFPAHYREWPFLSSGFDMSYDRGAAATPIVSAHSVFDNVFVNPASYRAFEATGHWPEGTMLVLEVRKGVEDASINKHGRTQGEVTGVELHVKDSAHTPTKIAPDGWSFYSFDSSPAPAARIAQTETCYTCHQQHAAVDTTFVQFYPTLLPIAQARHTLSPAFLADQPQPAKP